MRSSSSIAVAAACALWVSSAAAQSGPAAASAQAEVNRALANQPTFPNLRGGSLGIPRFTGEGSVSVQGAIRIDDKTPALDLFAALGNVDLTDRVALSLFAESTRLDAPRVAFDPNASVAPNPLLGIETQTFQAIGFRLRFRLVVDSTEAQAARCWNAVQQSRDSNRNGPRPNESSEARQLREHTARDEAATLAACDWAQSPFTSANLREYFYRLRQRTRYMGAHLFVGARYLYRGTPAANSTASGVAGEVGLIVQPHPDWTLFGSVAGTWLARSQANDGSNVVLLPQTSEVRATLGAGWRPTFDPARSLTVGIQGSLSWNWWQNELARGAQDRDVRGWAFEASVFASGHVGNNFNGLLSFGVLLPYGHPDDGPRFVFTFAPAVAAPTTTASASTTCRACQECRACEACHSCEAPAQPAQPAQPTQPTQPAQPAATTGGT